MPWPQEGSVMFDPRVMKTEFLNRPDDDPALVAVKLWKQPAPLVLKSKA